MLEMFITYSIVVSFFAPCAFSANILAVMPTASYSHQIAFLDFWKELSLRGHKVTLVTTDPLRNEKLTNLTEIDLSWTYRFYSDISKVAEQTQTMWYYHEWVHKLLMDVAETILPSSELQDLIHDKHKRYDLVLVEWFFPELLAFGKMHNCPTILIGSMDVYTKYYKVMGNAVHPAIYPGIGAFFDAPLSFTERIKSSLYYVYSSLFVDYKGFPARQKLLHKYFSSTYSIDKLVNDIDMLLITLSPVVQSVRALSPNTVYTGSLREKSVKPLHEDLKKYLDSAKNGFIYFSLGTNVKSKDLQEKSFNAILETLRELPYKVLWKFEADEEAMPRKPSNVKLIKWAPQLDILAHPNIKLFITQGGLQSMEETIYNEVPCVVIPFFADQHQNARLMKNKGIAEPVGRYPHIKKEDLKEAILQVINNPKYKNSVSKLNRLTTDIPMTGLEKAIWWTEYVIRNKGAKHLRNPTADLPLYQYYLLDVIGFLSLVLVGTLSIFIVLLKKVSNMFNRYLCKKQIQSTHRKLQ